MNLYLTDCDFIDSTSGIAIATRKFHIQLFPFTQQSITLLLIRLTMS